MTDEASPGTEERATLEELLHSSPEDSRFILDHVEGNRPRLSWRPPRRFLVHRLLGVLFVLIFMCGLIAGGIIFVLSGVLSTPPAGKLDLLARLFLCFVWGLAYAGLLLLLFHFFRRQRGESLTFGTSVLTYDIGTWWDEARDLSEVGSKIIWWPWQEVREIKRCEICTVRVEKPTYQERLIVGRVKPAFRQRLIVDLGVEKISIGHGLHEWEREWLAQVLQTWAAQ